jgi:hypothetical protein
VSNPKIARPGSGHATHRADFEASGPDHRKADTRARRKKWKNLHHLLPRAGEFELPANAVCAADLRVAAEHAMSGSKIEWVVGPPNPAASAFGIGGARAKVQGLFRRDFMRRYSFVAPACRRHRACVMTRTFCSIWAKDKYTVGRPHPMIDPSHRNQMLVDALNDGKTGVILLDLVIGYGATENPAGIDSPASCGCPELLADLLDLRRLKTTRT